MPWKLYVRPHSVTLKSVAPVRPLALPLPRGLVVYCDGACPNNGQEGARAGIGIFFGHGDARNVSRRLPASAYRQTNQVAELVAAITALEMLRAHREPVVVVTDSMYTVKSVNEWRAGWKRAGWVKKKPLVNLDLLRRLSDLVDGRAPGATHFVHVKGHANDAGNIQADLLATRGAAADE
jgi:ribonuclease HI